MRKRRSVALLLETSNAYARGLLDGIIAYQREHELWSIYVGEQQRGARPPVWIKTWKGDGIIARIETEAIAAAVRRSALPTVDVSAARLIPELPWVETEDREIAQMAARHLMDRGFRTLAFCGEPVFNWSSWRQNYFVEYARREGCECHVYQGKASIDINNGEVQVRENLAAGAGRAVVVRLANCPGNPSAIGARVVVRTRDGRRQTAEVSAGASYLAQSSGELHFGLRGEDRITKIDVRWPDGRETNFTPQDDKRIMIKYPVAQIGG